MQIVICFNEMEVIGIFVGGVGNEPLSRAVFLPVFKLENKTVVGRQLFSG
jgi:hypothetical protein